MNSIRTFTAVVLLIALMVVTAIPALAAERSITLTEDQINDAFIVTNPPRRTISNVVVDLQPDQAVVSATYTQRGKSPLDLVVTMVPGITNGRVYWTVSAALKNGDPVSQDVLNQINASIYYSWFNYVRRNAPNGRITAITVTEDALTITVTTR